MKSTLALIAIIVVSIGMGGCDRDQGNEAAGVSPPTEEVSVAAVAPPPVVLAGRHQRNLTCATGYEDFCGGWTIESADAGLAAKHIALNDKFVIGQKGQPTWLFARQSLMSRWNNTSKIRLYEFPDCLAGKVHLVSHGGDHEWHQITITREVTMVPEIGEEVGLEICFEVAEEQNANPPTSCTLDCPPVNPESPKDHGGIAHGND